MTFLKELGWTGYLVRVVGGYMKTVQRIENWMTRGKSIFALTAQCNNIISFLCFVIPVHESDVMHATFNLKYCVMHRTIW